MKLTRHTDYALRTLIYVALQKDQLSSIAGIARRYQISENHLMKVVQELGRTGYLTTVRGRGGGLRLGRPAAAIGLGDVVRAMEKDFDIAECSICILADACTLAPLFGQATAAFLAVLDRFTLKDVIWDGDPMRALLRLGIQPKGAAKKKGQPGAKHAAGLKKQGRG